MKPKKLTRDQIQNTVKNAIMEAVSFIEAEIAPDRIRAQKYFDGQVDLASEDGRSGVVATKCRDTIRAVKSVVGTGLIAASFFAEWHLKRTIARAARPCGPGASRRAKARRRA